MCAMGLYRLVGRLVVLLILALGAMLAEGGGPPPGAPAPPPGPWSPTPGGPPATPETGTRLLAPGAPAPAAIALVAAGRGPTDAGAASDGGPVPAPAPCEGARPGGHVELQGANVTFGSLVRDPALAAAMCDAEVGAARNHALGRGSPHARDPWSERGIPSPPGVPGPVPAPDGNGTWEWRAVGPHDATYTLVHRRGPPPR